jgi:ubiquitin-conjugating enzyme E2 J1
MDGDAKGQVGGVEAREEVRREWAKRSRKWKCDVCSGGKTNEELLAEWREACKTKGVKVDEEEESNDGKDSVPDGLRFGYKDEHGKVQDISQEQDVEKVPAAPAPKSHISASGTTPPTEPSPSPAAPQPGSLPVPNAETPVPSSSLPPPSTNPTSSSPSTTTRNPPPSSSIQPTRTIPQPRARLAPAASHAVHDTTAWMDRAISVVGISLIIMVLKKWIVPYLL